MGQNAAVRDLSRVAELHGCVSRETDGPVRPRAGCFRGAALPADEPFRSVSGGFLVSTRHPGDGPSRHPGDREMTRWRS